MTKFLKKFPTHFFCILALNLLVTDLCAEETEKDTAAVQTAVKKTEKDTSDYPFPIKLKARKPWEYIVSMPVWIATSPLWLLYKSTSGVIYVMDELDIPEKVERVLISEDGTREIMPEYSSRTGVGITW